jgi:hypothetical protein
MNDKLWRYFLSFLTSEEIMRLCKRIKIFKKHTKPKGAALTALLVKELADRKDEKVSGDTWPVIESATDEDAEV